MYRRKNEATQHELSEEKIQSSTVNKHISSYSFNMLWGGLKPIRKRFFLDVVALSGLGYSALIPTEGNFNSLDAFVSESTWEYSHLHGSILLLSMLVTYATAGLVKRWTVSFPMVPIVFMQYMRYFIRGSPRWEMVICMTSLALVFTSFLLTILFPAIEVREVEGQYNVGIVDLHLPVEGFVNDHVSVRLFYPTLENSVRMPYFNYESSDHTVEALVKLAPEPINKLSFILKQWQLCTIKGKRNAIPFIPSNELEKVGVDSKSNGEEKEMKMDDNDGDGDDNSKLPIIVYSHGLTGNVHIYSYQTMCMAANGSLVMSINHSDGSSIGFNRRDGSFQELDRSIGEVWAKGGHVESVLLRRKQLIYRSNEFIAASKALIKLNDMNVVELDRLGISFVGKLNTADLIASGHSFGAATALESANNTTDLFTACVAHDPAIDWCTDEFRRTLLHPDRFKGSRHVYTGGTGGYRVDVDETPKSPSVHDLDLFFLYSNEWADLGWGEYNLIRDLFKRGLLGRPNGSTDLGYVYNAHHSEFSDSCMKIPLWMARPLKMTGVRNPHDTAEEIKTRTQSFIEDVRNKSRPKQKKKP